MNTLLKAYYVSIFFFKIVETKKLGLDGLTTLVKDFQQLYLPRNIFIVYDGHQYGFDKEQMLLGAIKHQQDSMTQVITYEQLKLTSTRQNNILYALFIQDARDLQRAINATKNINMSLHPWLLYFTRDSHFDCDRVPKNFFTLKMNTIMTAHCEGSKTLKRYNSVIQGQVEILDLAEWLPEKKLKLISVKELVKIETDMKGITLRLALMEESIEEANKKAVDYNSHLRTELESFGNFSTKITVRESTLHYYDNSTQQRSGVLYSLHHQKADICSIAFIMSKARLEIADFTAPIIRFNYYLYARLPEQKFVPWNTYFKAFDLYIWFAIGLSILIVSILLTLVGKKCHGRIVRNPSEDFLIVWGIHCQQAPADLPSNTATQIMYFSIFVSALILNAIYAANITSCIAHLSPKLPFDTYEEFKLDKGYEVTVVNGSRDMVLIMEKDNYLEPLKSHLKPPNEFPVDPYEGFRQSCEEKTAFYSHDFYLKGIKLNPPCQLGKIPMNRVEDGYFILTKDSPYSKALGYYISRLRDHGILKRLQNKYFYEYTEIPTNEPNVISLEELMPIITVWFFGIILALIVWILELITFYLL